MMISSCVASPALGFPWPKQGESSGMTLSKIGTLAASDAVVDNHPRKVTCWINEPCGGTLSSGLSSFGNKLSDKMNLAEWNLPECMAGESDGTNS